MPEDTEDGGNVIEFPATSAKPPQPLTPEQVQQKAEESQDYITRLVVKNRHRGLEQLGKKLENLSKRDLISDPALEVTVRDLSQALQGTLTHLEALNSLVDMLAMDIGRAVQNAQIESDEKVHIAMHVQALIKVLVDKELITHEDMRAVFAELGPQVEAMREQATQEPEDSQ